MSIQTLKEEVSKLDKTEQAELMHFMVELLATEEIEISDAWKEEIEKREEALKNGTSIGRPAREVLAKYVILKSGKEDKKSAPLKHIH